VGRRDGAVKRRPSTKLLPSLPDLVHSLGCGRWPAPAKPVEMMLGSRHASPTHGSISMKCASL
jgi:hypothetical protein